MNFATGSAKRLSAVKTPISQFKRAALATAARNSATLYGIKPLLLHPESLLWVTRSI
jgi:hypothetical protein